MCLWFFFNIEQDNFGSKMFVVASSCAVVLFSLLCTSAQAFFTAPVPGFAHGLSIYDVNGAKRVGGPSAESNEVMTRGAGNDDEDEDEEADEPEIRNEEQTVLVVEFESEPSEKEDKDGNKASKEVSSDDSENQSPLDPWSIVWYIGSFGGLVAFFLIVSCSEWCCRRGARPLSSTYVQRGAGAGEHAAGASATETPPPPYHLFAPPPYDSVNYGDLVDKASGEKIDIFVISVPVPSTAHQPAPA